MKKLAKKFFVFKKSVKKIFLLVFLFCFITFPFFTKALDLGEDKAVSIGLGGTSPVVLAIRIVQILLGFLSLVAVCLIIYGGFLWMTSAGSEEKIDRAKKTLINSIIGLVIILSAFGIVTFVIGKMLDVSGVNPGGGPSTRRPPGRGIGSIGACSVEMVYPEDGQKDVPRNTSIIITFKEEMDSGTICDDANSDNRCIGEQILTDGRIKIYNTKDDPSNYIKDVKVYDTPDRKTFVLSPGNYLGSPVENTWYIAYISNDVFKADGSPAFKNCRSDFLEWSFEVSNRLDLEPPIIKNGGVFPPPDNLEDSISVISQAERAKGAFEIKTNPNIYTPASIVSAVSEGNSPAISIAPDLNCSQEGEYLLSVKSDDITLELSLDSISIASTKISDGKASLSGYFTLDTMGSNISAGNSWKIKIKAKKDADTITVQDTVYTYASDYFYPNNIKLGLNEEETASNTAFVINNHPKIKASKNGSKIEIEAVFAGKSGNNIELFSGNSDLISVSPMSGGSDLQEKADIADFPDQAMNSVVQINFNEPVLPILVSGKAEQVKDVIKIVNADLGAKPAGSACSLNSDCVSFKCENNLCAVGDYLAGEFRISNMYRTLEFISDNQCGVNGCGEPIYCLPEKSNLRVEIKSASLDACTSDSDCSAKNPYNKCIDNVCSQVFSGRFDNNGLTRQYPASNIALLDGVMDASFNSLDGDRDLSAEGRVSVYDENKNYSSNSDCQDKFEKIINSIISKRKTEDKVLGEITGNYNSADLCASGESSECLEQVAKISDVLGLGSILRDEGGNLFLIDENEDENQANTCSPGHVSSLSCGQIEIPYYYCKDGDNFQWSFYISDKLDTTPPKILSIDPDSGGKILHTDPVKISFSKLMMSSSLKTGSTYADNGKSKVMHKNLNLWGLGGFSPGYWILSENIDSNFDQILDKTNIEINHSEFPDLTSYRAQAGSGLRDIFQNCFRPSAGPGCGSLDLNTPSCCDKSAVSSLDEYGNCQ